MLVCRGWHATALSNFRLWTYIYPLEYEEDVYTRNLARSKDAPLDVFLDFENAAEWVSGLLPTLAHLIDRIRTLTVTFSTDNPQRDNLLLHRTFENCRAPLLQELRIAPRFAPDPDMMLDFLGTEGLLPPIFRELPALRKLTLTDVFYYPPGLFRNLDEITLSTVREDSISVMVDKLVDLLALSPLVRSLRLEGIINPCSVLPVFHNRTPVHLPRLEMLYIADWSISIEAFMKFIRPPCTAQIKLEAMMQDWRTYNTTPFTPVMQLLTGGGLTVIEPLLLVSEFDFSVNEEDDFVWVGRDDDGDTVFDLSVGKTAWHEEPGDRNFIARTLMALAPFPTQQILEVTLDRYTAQRLSSTTEGWASFLSSFPMLTTLNIDQAPPETIWGALMAFDGTVLCRDLSVFRIQHIDHLMPWVCSLYNVLQSRASANAGVDEVVIEICPFLQPDAFNDIDDMLRVFRLEIALHIPTVTVSSVPSDIGQWPEPPCP